MTVVEDNVRKSLSPSSSVLLLAKIIMHPAALSLCDSEHLVLHNKQMYTAYISHKSPYYITQGQRKQPVYS